MRKFRLATATVACFSPATLVAAQNGLVAVNEDGAFFCQDPDAQSIAGNEAEKQRHGEVNYDGYARLRLRPARAQHADDPAGRSRR
jgi:hypothetical protein